MAKVPSMVLVVCGLTSFISASPESPINNRRLNFINSAKLARKMPFGVSGYRPQAEQFRFPARQQQGYVYPPPEVEDQSEEIPVTSTEIPQTTTLREIDAKKDTEEQSSNSEGQTYEQRSTYYIYYPDGLLQKVAYAAKTEDMGFTARLTYKDVEPIKDPIYTYDPKTLVFSKIAF